MKKSFIIIIIFMVFLCGCNKKPNNTTSYENTSEKDSNTYTPSNTGEIIDEQEENASTSNNTSTNDIVPSTSTEESQEQSSEESKTERKTSGVVWSDNEDWGPLHT